MKLTLRLITTLRRLVSGESVAYSAVAKSLYDPLVREGVLTVEYHGTNRALRAPNAEALMLALPDLNEALRDLDAAERIVNADSSRAAQAAVSGNSKTRTERSCPGFLVNSYEPICCTLRGREFIIAPAEGSAVYVADWASFVPPADVMIVGVENMANFLEIRRQRKLIDSFLDSNERGVLFAARYAFSSDLAKWLGTLPNRYLHFGDFDLAGIDIFLNQFKPSVGARGSFLIPRDIDARISRGSRERYDAQYARYASLTTSDPSLQHLIATIHRCRRTYDQEGYILPGRKFNG